MSASMKKFKRTHNLQHIKQDDAYTLKEVTELFSVSRTTVNSWVKEGLAKIDNKLPTLFHGSDLYQFLAKRQANRKTKLSEGQYYCVRCQKATDAKSGTETVTISKAGNPVKHAECGLCGGKINRFVKRSK